LLNKIDVLQKILRVPTSKLVIREDDPDTGPPSSLMRLPETPRFKMEKIGTFTRSYFFVWSDIEIESHYLSFSFDKLATSHVVLLVVGDHWQ
jgi:hypothetical protein